MKTGSPERPLRIGLTGGFGTGKSTVAGMLAARGALIVDADRLARKALRRGSDGYRRAVRIFGRKILDRAGRIKRRALAEEVFDRPERLRRLNRIVHPPVIRAIAETLRRSRRPVVAVVPLLFEAGTEGMFDRVVAVVAAPETVIARTAWKRRMTTEEIARRQKAQLPLAEKARRADYVIDNGGTLSATRRQVEAVWGKLQITNHKYQTKYKSQ
ncbi:MAG: dephospho-CoA kinase [Candidatus Aureabacteria bacterium]|nr:dephospho-CoA kinase [Candidatus Auribacterota bacterium]